MSLALREVWNNYKAFTVSLIKGNFPYEINSIVEWRKKLFFNIILYSTPISLVALVPSMVYLLKYNFLFVAAFDMFAAISIPAVALNNYIGLIYKKAFVVAVFYLLAILMMAALGSFALGSLYLLGLSVFITLLYSRRVVIWSVAANVVMFGFFAVVIHYRLYNSLLIQRNDTFTWMVYAANFMFLNIAVVVMIRHITTGLEKKIIQEAGLRKSLQEEIKDKILLNNQLSESEEHYRTLFLRNPSPMWIFNAETLNFLQVNAAAIRKYGYTREEFKTMLITDIRPREDVDDLLLILQTLKIRSTPSISTVKHINKKGQVFYAEVRCSNIPFKGKDERLVIARDITDQIQHVLAIEKQNAQLRDIAYLQSHVVRAPLCRILGLINVINSNKITFDSDILDHLNTSVNELDEVIRAIISKTEETTRSFKE